MQQDAKARRRQTLVFLLWTYLALFAYLQFFGPKPKPPAAQTESVLTQAKALEAEGRKTDSAVVSKADRIKKLEQAIGKYEEFYNQRKGTPEASQARFQQINIYDYLAQMEGKSSSTHWYDQAEMKLKDMEKALHRKTGDVTLEVRGEPVRRSGDLSEIASWRLNEIRQARNERNEDKTLYRILDFFVAITGRQPGFSYFFALTLIVVLLKVATWPFQKKQYQYQQDMMRIQPKIKEMQEQMKGKPPEDVNRRMMQLYKENNVNIAGGCLPMLVTMIVLFPVFWMVRDYEFQFTNGHFLWIGSELSSRVWWLGDNLAQFDVPLFVIYLISTVAYSFLQPKPADPQQAQQQKMMLIMMPLMFGVMMWMYQWSSAFMLYWLVLNIVSMYQSWVLMRHFGLSGMGSSKPAAASAVVLDAAPASLEPMKGAAADRAANGRNGRGSPRGAPSRARPKGPRGR